jgi:hypothetical protein
MTIPFFSLSLTVDSFREHQEKYARLVVGINVEQQDVQWHRFQNLSKRLFPLNRSVGDRRVFLVCKASAKSSGPTSSYPMLMSLIGICWGSPSIGRANWPPSTNVFLLNQSPEAAKPSNSSLLPHSKGFRRRSASGRRHHTVVNAVCPVRGLEPRVAAQVVSRALDIGRDTA